MDDFMCYQRDDLMTQKKIMEFEIKKMHSELDAENRSFFYMFGDNATWNKIHLLGIDTIISGRFNHGALIDNNVKWLLVWRFLKEDKDFEACIDIEVVNKQKIAYIKDYQAWT